LNAALAPHAQRAVAGGSLPLFCEGRFVFNAVFPASPHSFCRLVTASPETPARHCAAPSEDYFHAGGLEARLFREQGDRRMRGKQSSKKKHMKTTSQKKSNRLSQESKQSQQAAEQPQAQPKPDNRLPIDTEARKKNRTLPTEQVLALLQIQDRRLWEMAEVVGKWIWVSFTESPAAEVRQTLAQLGFHWNRTRQSWQHPCGQFRLSSSGDPREKYPSRHPAEMRTA
jgi:hypothetical protein